MGTLIFLVGVHSEICHCLWGWCLLPWQPIEWFSPCARWEGHGMVVMSLSSTMSWILLSISLVIATFIAASSCCGGMLSSLASLSSLLRFFVCIGVFCTDLLSGLLFGPCPGCPGPHCLGPPVFSISINTENQCRTRALYLCRMRFRNHEHSIGDFVANLANLAYFPRCLPHSSRLHGWRPPLRRRFQCQHTAARQHCTSTSCDMVSSRSCTGPIAPLCNPLDAK